MKTDFIECGGVGDSCPHMEGDRRCQLVAGACTLQVAEATRNQAPFGLLERFVMWFWPLLLLGCSGATGNVTASDPLERGLSYVAAAIVTHGILQIFFRK